MMLYGMKIIESALERVYYLDKDTYLLANSLIKRLSCCHTYYTILSQNAVLRLNYTVYLLHLQNVPELKLS